MALSARQKTILARAFEFAQGGGETPIERRYQALFNHSIKSAAEQSTEKRAWIAAYRTHRLDKRAELEQSKLDNEALIDVEVADADAILAGGDV